MHNKSSITDLAFTSENLYSFLNHNPDFHRRLTNIFTHTPTPITQHKTSSSKLTHHTSHTRPKPSPTPPVSIQYPDGTVIKCFACNRSYCYTDECQFTLCDKESTKRYPPTRFVSYCSQHRPSPIPRIHPNYTKIHCQVCDTSYRYITGVNFQRDYTPSNPDTYVHFCAHHEPEDHGIFI